MASFSAVTVLYPGICYRGVRFFKENRLTLGVPPLIGLYRESCITAGIGINILITISVVNQRF